MKSINIIISIDKKSIDVINPLIKSIIMHNDANIFVITDEYIEETRFEVKPSLWERITQSKFVQAIKRITKIRVVLDVPALPEGRGEN